MLPWNITNNISFFLSFSLFFFFFSFYNFKAQRKSVGVEEALKILNVGKEDLRDPAKIHEQYNRYFTNNEVENGGSFYLQSKVYRAKESLDKEMGDLYPELVQKFQEELKRREEEEKMKEDEEMEEKEDNNRGDRASARIKKFK